MALALEPGKVVGGKYRLLRLLGRGGMGEVWAAEQSITANRVAMKFLLGGATADEGTRRRFLREARAACAVNHPNVVKIHDVLELEDGTPAMIMELFEGESLEAKLARDKVMSVEETVGVMLRVVSAVGTAHSRGIVHRDLKPENIFLVETPEGTDIKVLDFGIAKMGVTEGAAAQTAGLTKTGAMLGTPYYMSPEQAFGERDVDHHADIWSLGVVMYRCLTGELPTQADNLGQILKLIMTRSIPKLVDTAPHVPRELAELVDSMLSYAPADRPADLRAVRATLERCLGLEPIEPAPERPSQPSAPRPAPLGLTASLITDFGPAETPLRLSESADNPLSATGDGAALDKSPIRSSRDAAPASTKSGSTITSSGGSRVTRLAAVLVLALVGVGVTAIVFQRRAHNDPSAVGSSGAQSPESTTPESTTPTLSAVATATPPPETPPSPPIKPDPGTDSSPARGTTGKSPVIGLSPGTGQHSTGSANALTTPVPPETSPGRRGIVSSVPF